MKNPTITIATIIFFTLSFLFLTTSIQAANDVIGTLNTPSLRATDLTDTGNIINIIIKVFVIIAGIFSLWQFLTSGFAYITSNGDKGKISQATTKLNMAIIGLVLIASSLIITGILSWALFGDPKALLDPKLHTLP